MDQNYDYDDVAYFPNVLETVPGRSLDYVAPWHQDEPSVLQRAFESTDKATALLGDLDDVRQADLNWLANVMLPVLPRRPYACQNLRSRDSVNRIVPMMLADAVLAPWFRPNTGAGVNVIAVSTRRENVKRFDVFPDSILPTCIVVDDYGEEVHCLFALSNSVSTTPGARKKPQAALHLAHALLAVALDGRVIPVDALVRSPWGRTDWLTGTDKTLVRGPVAELCWHTQVSECPGVSLTVVISELFDNYNALLPATYRRHGAPAVGTRAHLFDAVRRHCFENKVTDRDDIYSYASTVNASYQHPFDTTVVERMSEKVSVFMVERFQHRKPIRRGVMSLVSEQELTPLERRQASARRTHSIRSAGTERLLQNAIAAWPAGTTLTKIALAEATGLSLSTVKRAWSVLQVDGRYLKVPVKRASTSKPARKAPPKDRRQKTPMSGHSTLAELDADRIRLLAYVDHVRGWENEVRAAGTVRQLRTLFTRAPRSAFETLGLDRPHKMLESEFDAANAAKSAAYLAWRKRRDEFLALEAA